MTKNAHTPGPWTWYKSQRISQIPRRSRPGSRGGGVMDKPTPLTDAVEDGKPGKRWPVMCEHARRMERDRAELIAELERLCVEIAKQLGSNTPLKSALLDRMKVTP